MITCVTLDQANTLLFYGIATFVFLGEKSNAVVFRNVIKLAQRDFVADGLFEITTITIKHDRHVDRKDTQPQSTTHPRKSELEFDKYVYSARSFVCQFASFHEYLC